MMVLMVMLCRLLCCWLRTNQRSDQIPLSLTPDLGLIFPQYWTCLASWIQELFAIFRVNLKQNWTLFSLKPHSNIVIVLLNVCSKNRTMETLIERIKELCDVCLHQAPGWTIRRIWYLRRCFLPSLLYLHQVQGVTWCVADNEEEYWVADMMGPSRRWCWS